MDVVMVKDFGSLLNLASTATALEQQRKEAESKLVLGHKAGTLAVHGSAAVAAAQHTAPLAPS
jgi:hypothetical protein